MRLGLGDGVTEEVSAALRRITRTARTALMTPVSNKTAQMARIHEPRSGQPSKIQSHDGAPNKFANSEAPSKMATGKATSQVSRRPRRRNWGLRCWRCSNFVAQRRRRRSGHGRRRVYEGAAEHDLRHHAHDHRYHDANVGFDEDDDGYDAPHGRHDESSHGHRARSPAGASSDDHTASVTARRLEANQARVLPGLLIFLDGCRLNRPRDRGACVERWFPSQLSPNPCRGVRIFPHDE